MNYKKLCIFLLVILALLVVNIPTSSAKEQTPRFEPTQCKFDVPAGHTVECGYVVVPEARTKTNYRTIKLFVAIFKAQSQNPLPDPIVYLEGGPGGHNFEHLDVSLKWFAPYMKDRDFIMFDQRGVGLSEPNLDCTELTKVSYDTLQLRSTSDTRAWAEFLALQRCRNRLRTMTNLSDYSTSENAADVNDVRIALGYDQWNLYGISYGTRLALITMRDFPKGVRSVILDSTFPPNKGLYGGEFDKNARRAFHALWNGCTQDAACNHDFPKLSLAFDALSKQLDKKPLTIKMNDSYGRKYNAVIDGNILYSMIFSALYSKSLIPVLPAVIYTAYKGDYGLLTRLATKMLTIEDDISYGMYFSVMCSDRSQPPDLCDWWGVQPNVQVQPRPVKSNVPTIVFAGEYDPVTPPSYGKQTADALAHSYFFQFPAYGHGVTVDGICPATMMLEFLATPDQKPDSSCMVGLPEPEFVLSAF